MWLEMKQRCHNPKHPKFKYYGGRGIRVCQRWLCSFETFIADLGRRPAGLTLDRIETNGDYCPSNCRWATWETQRRNKRTNRWFEFNGKKMVLPDWAKETGIPLGTLRQRLLETGWSVERAFTESPGTRKSNNRWITFRGKTKTGAEWARTLGISYQTLKTRINKLKWSTDRALSTPVGMAVA